MAKAKQKARQKKPLTAKQAARLAGAHLKALDAGKRAYRQADEALDKLLAAGFAGKTIELAGGRRAKIIDRFAAKNKIFRPTGIGRYELDVEEAK